MQCIASLTLTALMISAGGTATFTSVRRGKEGKFEVLRWKITRDDGAVLDLRAMDPRAPEMGSSNEHLV